MMAMTVSGIRSHERTPLLVALGAVMLFVLWLAGSVLQPQAGVVLVTGHLLVGWILAARPPTAAGFGTEVTTLAAAASMPLPLYIVLWATGTIEVDSLLVVLAAVGAAVLLGAIAARSVVALAATLRIAALPAALALQVLPAFAFWSLRDGLLTGMGL